MPMQNDDDRDDWDDYLWLLASLALLVSAGIMWLCVFGM